MVRIVDTEKKEQPKPPQVPKLTHESKVLLRVIGILIADDPGSLIELLESYSVELPDKPTEEELTDQLLYAVCEGNEEFNLELAEIILNCTMNYEYDTFDFKSLMGSGGGGEGAEGSSGGGGGIVGGIANAIGGVGNAIGQGIQRKQAKEQATSQTLQGIYAYRTQAASDAENSKKMKMMMMLAFFVVLGLALTGLAIYMKKQNEAQQNPLKPKV